MLSTVAVPLLPATGVTHTVSGCFSGVTGSVEVLTFAQNQTTLYRASQAPQPHLEFIVEFPLHAPPLAAAVCRPINSNSDVVILLFDDAHVSFLKYNPKDLTFTSVALVQIMDQEVLKEGCSLQPILRVDESSSYVAVLSKRTALFVIPLLGFVTDDASLSVGEAEEERPKEEHTVQLSAWGDEDEPEEPKPPAQLSGRSEAEPAAGTEAPKLLKLGHISTFVIQNIRREIRNIRDFHFVSSNSDPLLVFLYEKYPTWAGRVKVLEWKSDTVENHMLTCSISWVSISRPQTESAQLFHIGELDYLPYSSTHLSPLPSFGGVTALLCVSANTVVCIESSQRGFGCYFNAYGEEEVKDLRSAAWTYQKVAWSNPAIERSRDRVKTNLRFANSAIIPVSSGEDSDSLSVILLTEDEGTVVRLTLRAEGFTINQMSANLIASGYFTSCHCQLFESVFYLGSCSSESRVVNLTSSGINVLQAFPSFGSIRSAAFIESSGAVLQQQQQQTAADNDEITSTPFAALFRKASVTFAPKLNEKLKRSCLAIACGSGSAGAVSLVRYGARDDILPSGTSIHGSALFVIRGSSDGTANHLVVSGPSYSIYFSLGIKIEHLRGALIETSRTIFAAFLPWSNAVLQVTQNELAVFSVNGKSRIQSSELTSLLKEATVEAKAALLVESVKSLFLLLSNGLLHRIDLSDLSEMASSVVASDVSAVTYWHSRDTMAVLTQTDLVLYSPQEFEETGRYYSLGLLPALCEENVRNVPIAPGRRLAEALPTINALRIYDHPSPDNGATLICRLTSGELLAYQILQADAFGSTRLRKSFHHFLDVECYTESIETIAAKKRRLEEEQRRSDESDLEGNDDHVLCEFSGINGLSGVYACGRNPLFFFYDSTHRRMIPCLHRKQGRAVKSFACFDSPTSPGMYVYCSDDSSVVFATFPSIGTPLGNGWWAQHIPLGRTPHHVIAAPEVQGCLVVTSELETFCPQKASFDVSLNIVYDEDGNKTVTVKPNTAPPPLAFSENTLAPQNDRYSLRLISCSKAEEIDSLLLDRNEKVLCAERIQVEYSSSSEATSSDLVNLYAIGTGFPLGEDVATAGRLLLVNMMTRGNSQKMQILHSESLKGPVTAITRISQHIAVAVGGTIRVFKFNWESRKCEMVLFLYAGVYISSMSSFKDYLLFGDLYSSITMARFCASDRTLTVLGKDLHRIPSTQCVAIHHDAGFGVVATDDDRNLVILGYTPRLEEKKDQPGERVVMQSILSSDSEYRLPGGSVSKVLRFHNHSNSSSLLYFTNYGEIGCLTPISSSTNRTLQWVVHRLQSDTCHTAGLSPQIFLATRKESVQWSVAAKQRVIHFPLIRQLYLSDVQTRASLAASALTQSNKTLRIGTAIVESCLF